MSSGRSADKPKKKKKKQKIVEDPKVRPPGWDCRGNAGVGSCCALSPVLLSFLLPAQVIRDLVAACQGRDERKLRGILSDPVFSKQYDLVTGSAMDALVAAAAVGDLKCIETLLEYKASPNVYSGKVSCASSLTPSASLALSAHLTPTPTLLPPSPPPPHPPPGSACTRLQ